jgi:hypothetical protein
LRHVISNLIARVDGDRGRATCYATVFLTRDGASRPLPPGQNVALANSQGYAAGGRAILFGIASMADHFFCVPMEMRG